MNNAFGLMLRSSRLGFRHMPALDAWVRIAGDGPPYRVDVVREASDMTPIPGLYACWWEGDPEGAKVLLASPALREVVHTPDYGFPRTLWIGDDGEEVSR